MAGFVLNPVGVAELGVSPQMGEAVEKMTAEIEAAAKAYAPVRTGAYRDSIASSLEIVGDVYVGKVTASAPYARFIEFGTSDTPTFQPLRKALDTFRI